jgi:hypothetical protein
MTTPGTITVTTLASDYGPNTRASICVGDITLSLSLNAPWESIEAEARRREAADAEAGKTHYGPTLAFWYHRGTLEAEWTNARRTMLLAAAALISHLAD